MSRWLTALAGDDVEERAKWVERRLDGTEAGDRGAAITNDPRQRAKMLSAAVQRNLCEAQRAAAIAKKDTIAGNKTARAPKSAPTTRRPRRSWG